MLFRLVFFDDITSRDLFSLIDAIVAIERGRLVVPNRLTDLSQIAEALVTFTDMLAFVERPKVHRLANSVKSAIVASRPVQVGFARMFQMLNDHPQIEIELFDTVEVAEAWLATP